MKQRYIMRKQLFAIALVGAAVLLAGCKEKTAATSETLPIINKALNDTASIFYADFDNYPNDLRQLPIGVFDSGTGGLTVLERLLALDTHDNITGEGKTDAILDFAGEHFIYLADQANMPYGVYDAQGKADYLRELIVKDALFLMGDRYYENKFQESPEGVKPSVKIMVIACNTATAYGLKSIQSMLEKSGTGVKVIGVVNAGSKAALDKTADENAPFAIGALATQGTISSGAYERTIKEIAAERGIKTDITVVNQSGYGFAESVDSEPDYVNVALTEPRESYRGPRFGQEDADIKPELLPVYNFEMDNYKVLYSKDDEGNYVDFQLNNAVNYARFNLVSLVERHRQSGSQAPLKAVIMGCTHYPYLLNTMQQVIEELRNYTVNGTHPYRNLIADDFEFIDPAVYTAIECYETLRADGNLALRTTEMTVAPYISVPSSSLPADCVNADGALIYDFKYGREVGTEDITTKQVPFSKSNIDATNLERIKVLLPYTYSLIYPTME